MARKATKGDVVPVVADEEHDGRIDRGHKYKEVACGHTYRITDGRYKGRLAKVRGLVPMNRMFAFVVFLDAFGKDTKTMDVIPIRLME
jgi:hypothetical protein